MEADNKTPDSEPQAAREIAVVPDSALTMQASRLAGSTACLNCGTILKGPFCYYCGQPDRNFMRFFPALLREFMSDFLEFDSRFARTMKPLLFQPGRLTRDFLEGRRFRYTPPMRLYLFSSIAFFILAAAISSNAIKTGRNSADPNAGPMITITKDEDDLKQAREAIENLPPEVRDELNLDLGALQLKTENKTNENAGPLDADGENAGAEPDPDKPNWFTTEDIQFNDQPWDREKNPIDIPFAPDWVNDLLNDEVEGSPKKAEQINNNPNLIVEKVFDILPATMFVLLPVVALLFKFWYLFARRYYVEHLIFALHNHAFLFVSLLLILLINIIAAWLESLGIETASTVATWFITIISIWIPLYLLISLRHVYRQNWFFTLCKFGVIGISYVTLLGLVTSIVAILSFVLL